MNISAFFPAYNEEEAIANQIKSIQHALVSNKITHEIIVVDDGSQDRTAELIAILSREKKMDQRYPLLGIYIVLCLLSPLFVMSFSGCATAHKEQKIVSVKEDILFETKEEPVKKNTGSLWQDNGSLSELFY